MMNQMMEEKNSFISHLLNKKVKRDFIQELQPLRDIAKGRVLFNESLARYTTFRVGGPADGMVFPQDQNDLIGILKFCDEQKIPVFILGGGSNLLVRDGGIRGLVICLRQGFDQLEEISHEQVANLAKGVMPEDVSNEDVFFRVEAGYSLPRLIRTMANWGFSGLEGLAGVVGCVGGALSMNAGTRNGEMGDRVVAIFAVNKQGQTKTFIRKQLKFTYRNLDIDGTWIFLDTILRLKKSSPEKVTAKVKEYLDYRQKTQPLNLPNAGSVFKNPKKITAGEVIENQGLKGVRLRGAKVSELHGNWIVNLGDATSQDILQLIAMIKDKVKEDQDIQLETEVKIVGENQSDG